MNNVAYAVIAVVDGEAFVSATKLTRRGASAECKRRDESDPGVEHLMVVDRGYTAGDGILVGCEEVAA